MDEKCANCEAESLENEAELRIEVYRLENYSALLEKCLDQKEELNKVLRERNEEMKNRVRVLEEVNKRYQKK